MRLLLLLPLAAPALAHAQNLQDAPVPNISASIEATIEGLPSRAAIRFETPDGLSVSIAPNDVVGSPARAIQASGAQTMVIEGKRARRGGFNGLSQWFRSANEPLLQALGPWLVPTRELEASYTLVTAKEGEATIIEARANDSGKRARRDIVRSGGAGGQRFYAARTVPAWNRPARMRLRIEAGHIVRREDFGPGASTRALQTWTWRYQNSRPTLIEARDARDIVRARWSLRFDAPAPIAAAEVPAEAIIEGDAPADDQPDDQPAQLFARGVQAARTENYAPAVAALGQAAQLKPRAIAVPLALFEIALSMRNEALAQSALLKIQALEGEAAPASAVARARLALQRGSEDQGAALDALPQVLAARAGGPGGLLRLQIADLMRAGGRRQAGAEMLLPLLEEGVPAPLASQSVARLGGWFSPLDDAARRDLAGRITAKSLAAQVARAVLLDQSPANLDASASPDLEFLLAQHAALAGRDEEAARRWKAALERADEALWLRSQLALAQLAARRNDAPSALEAHRAAWPLLRGEGAREGWLRSLLLSWQKENRTQTLRGALNAPARAPLSRPRAGEGTDSLDRAEAEARLLAAVDEAEGDAIPTLRSQAARWKGIEDRGAWWQGRLAESLTGAASQNAGVAEPGPGREAARERLYDEAARAVDAARALDPEQPFYAEQKALIATRRLATQGPVTDAATGVHAREGAQAAIEELRTRFPEDADALLSAGLALLTIKQERGAVPLLRAAMAQLDVLASQDEAGDGGERVARISARASLAGALRKAGDAQGAMRLYALLFEGARSPVEQGAFAANWLNALFEAREPGGAAAILSRVARSSWKPSQTQAVLAQVLATVSPRAPWRLAIRQSLEAVLQPAPATARGANAAPDLSEGAALVAAYLDFSALNAARRAVAPAPAPAPAPEKPETTAGADAPAAAVAPAPAAPTIEAQQAWSNAVQVWRLDVARLEKLVSAGPGVAGQALSLLAQDSLLRGQNAEAATFLERALERVPGDEGLALSLSSALAPEEKAPLAPEDAARIVRARDALLARGTLDASALQGGAAMSRNAGRAEDARRLLKRARALSFFDDSLSPDAYDALAPADAPAPK